MHAWEQEGITGPDIQTVAKALGGGFAPIAGVLLSKKVVSALENGTGVLLHGHTYQVATLPPTPKQTLTAPLQAHPTACAAAAEVQRIIKRENLLANVVTQGALLSSLLKSKVLPSPIVGDVRGRGLFWGIEFIKDKATKTPFPRKLNVAARVAARGMKMGLGLLPTNGAGDVWDMDMIIVSPPYIVTEKEVRQIVDLLVEVIESIQTELV